MDDTSAEEGQNEQGLGEDEWLSGAFCVVFVEDIRDPWEVGRERKEGRSAQHLPSRDKLNKVQYQLK
jgi:hypothetical protein